MIPSYLYIFVIVKCGYQGELVVETSLVGNVLNGLSHFHRVRDRSQFAMCLIRGLGGNLTESSREEFAKQVLSLIPVCDYCFNLLICLISVLFS